MWVILLFFSAHNHLTDRHLCGKVTLGPNRGPHQPIFPHAVTRGHTPSLLTIERDVRTFKMRGKLSSGHFFSLSLPQGRCYDPGSEEAFEPWIYVVIVPFDS